MSDNRNFKVGDIVRKIGTQREHCLESINSNPNYVADDELWGEAYSGYWGTLDIDSPEDIELVMSAQDAASRQLPTVQNILTEVSHALHSGWGDVVEVEETQVEPQGYITVMGTAANGLRVNFELHIANLEEEML